jgi:hypothetical protein
MNSSAWVDDDGVKCGAKKNYRTIARTRTGAVPGNLPFAGATMMSEPVAGKEVKGAVPSRT